MQREPRHLREVRHRRLARVALPVRVRRERDGGVPGGVRRDGAETVGVQRQRVHEVLSTEPVIVAPPHPTPLPASGPDVPVGHVTFDGMFEVFNLFNHANYGTYVNNVSSPLYGRPASNSNVAYQPRMMQLGFKIGF